MKTPEQFTADVSRRLTNTWQTDIARTATSWPHTFALGEIPRAELETDFSTALKQAHAWRDWAADKPVAVTNGNRRVHGTTQPIPTHVSVPDVDSAARIAGGEWPARLARARVRMDEIERQFPGTAVAAQCLRTTDGYSDADFELLLRAARWFSENDASGLTPRQVPIEGFHAKWLNTHQSLILALTERTSLNLLPRHPARIHFTYLDPAHIADGGRKHDSATVGDAFTPAYKPTVVIICENKDTVIHFPPVAGGIAVEGEGFGGSAVAAFDWIVEASHVLYWGDIDAHGYEILDGFRQAGVPARSILMDLATYREYAQYGSDTDASGRPLTAGRRRDLPHLSPSELEVYEHLTASVADGPRRIEQERIPLTAAAAKVLTALAEE